MRGLLSVMMLLALVVFLVPGYVGAMERAIYEGHPAADLGIKVGPWGSGTAEESSDHIVANSKSIKILSQGFHSGGRIDFTKPVTVYAETPAPQQYLRFLIAFTGMETVASVYDYGDPVVRPRVKQVRLVIYPESQDQRPVEVVAPVGIADQDGWWPVAVPLSMLREQEEGSGFKVKRILVFSDVTDTLYLGEIRTVTDTTPITVEPLEPQPPITQTNYPVALIAVASGGVSPLTYHWDFDKSDGIQEDATGEQIMYYFKKPGEFTVTLTVKDVFGIKKPATTAVEVSVND